MFWELTMTGPACQAQASQAKMWGRGSFSWELLNMQSMQFVHWTWVRRVRAGAKGSLSTDLCQFLNQWRVSLTCWVKEEVCWESGAQHVTWSCPLSPCKSKFLSVGGASCCQILPCCHQQIGPPHSAAHRPASYWAAGGLAFHTHQMGWAHRAVPGFCRLLQDQRRRCPSWGAHVLHCCLPLLLELGGTVTGSARAPHLCRWWCAVRPTYNLSGLLLLGAGWSACEATVSRCHQLHLIPSSLSQLPRVCHRIDWHNSIGTLVHTGLSGCIMSTELANDQSLSREWALCEECWVDPTPLLDMPRSCSLQGYQ